MKPSTLMKIGISGTALSIIAGFIPLLTALLGDDGISMWVHQYINEGNLTVMLMVFAAIIIYAAVKMSEESKEKSKERE